MLVTGGLAHKVKAAIEAIPVSDPQTKENWTGFWVHRDAGYSYSLTWTVQCREQFSPGKHDGADSVGASATFYCGELVRDAHNIGGATVFLEKVLEPRTLPTDYTEEGIQAARAKVVATKRAYDEAKGWDNLGPFGENDQ